MKIVKNKKAFTLVELLAVIVILGVLLTDSINVYFPNWLRYFTISDNPFLKQFFN